MLKNLVKHLLRAPAMAARARRERRVLPALETAEARFGEGDYSAVVAVCREALIHEPRSAQANHLCGRALVELDMSGEAKPYLRAAVNADPGLAQAHVDLAAVLFRTGDYADAEECCRRALAIHAADVGCRLLLAEILKAVNRGKEAVAELTVAQEYAPERLDLLVKLVEELDRHGLYAEALRIAERAIAEVGDKFETLLCLAVARKATEDMHGAVEACRKALALGGDQARVLVILGAALLVLGKTDESMAAYRRALKLVPGYADAQFHLGLLNLTRGKYREGWPDFEQRLRTEQFRRYPACTPRWNGTSLHGRTLLIRREQGLGDEIMYASCFPQVIDSARHCYIECEPRLDRLFTRSFPRATFFTSSGMERVVPPFIPEADIDVKSFAASLPRYLRNSQRDFPAHSGYLKAAPERVDWWRSRLATLGSGLKVGISWRGGTDRTGKGRRSIALEALHPLLSVTGVHWVCLQYGERAAEIARYTAAQGIVITDWPEAIDGDYDETAALVCGLDLVISVCSSIVHLTGALGRTVWVMTPFVPEWRYGLTGETMPWYPAARLIRQTEYGNWDAVIQAVTVALQQKVDGH